MQSGGGAVGRNMAASASASPSSSPSAASAPHSGFDPIQQKQQQQHQLQRQSFHQQLLRTPEGNEANIAYQGGGLPGILGGENSVSNSGPMPLPQQSRKLVDFGQQHGFPYMGEEVQNRSQGFDQQMLNPVYQAYLQSVYQTAQQKSAMGMQPQKQMEMGMVGPSGKDLDMPLGNLKMQDPISSQAANQAQALLSNKQSEQLIRGESLTEEQQQISDWSSGPKPLIAQTSVGQLMPGNIMRPLQVPKSQQSIQNMANSQLVMTTQMQAMQALALEHNIDLSLPANLNLMAQLIPLMQSRMVAQHKVTESNMGAHSSSVPMTTQQVTSPQVVKENSPHGNSSSDMSGHSGSNKVRQTVPPVPFGASGASLVKNPNNILVQQFANHSRENQLPSRQCIMIGNGTPPMHPPHSSVNLNQGVDHSVLGKSTLPGPEALQMQHTKPMHRSSSHLQLHLVKGDWEIPYHLRVDQCIRCNSNILDLPNSNSTFLKHK